MDKNHRTTLRMPPELYQRLEAVAPDSVNKEIIRRLNASFEENADLPTLLRQAAQKIEFSNSTPNRNG